MAEALLLPLGIRDQTWLLVVERNAGFLPQSQHAGILGDAVDADPLTELVKIDIAGLHYPLIKIDGAVTFLLPVAKDAVAEGH